MTINLLEGDNCEWMDKMLEQGMKVDLVVTSPPYDNIRNYNGEGNLWDFEVFKKVADRLYKLINDGCVAVLAAMVMMSEGDSVGHSSSHWAMMPVATGDDIDVPELEFQAWWRPS